MKKVLGLTAALAFTAAGMVATDAMAQGNTPAMQSGSNATDMSSGSKMSGGKMSGGKMMPKKHMKKGMKKRM